MNPRAIGHACLVVAGALCAVSTAAGSHATNGVRATETLGVVYQESVLHAFSGSPDGAGPDQGLVADTAGNFYGVTGGGGADGHGTAYKLTRSGSSYVETVIYSFTGGDDGAIPSGQLYVRYGAVYGTTQSGGANSCGTVYKLQPGGSSYSEQTLFQFDCNSTGNAPLSGVVGDGAGDFFGTTSLGGSASDGVVFELTPNGSTYSETVIHDFTGISNDGQTPWGGLIFGNDGTILGTTAFGGAAGVGTVFELKKSGSTYQETILHSFTSSGDGASPETALIADSKGNLYGTTAYGGAQNCGTVYKMTASGSDYTESVLYAFQYSLGSDPYGSLIADSSGDLFGVASFGGKKKYGTIYELSPNGNAYTARRIYDFVGHADGGRPAGALVADASGDLYGTGTASKYTTDGNVFKLTPR